MYHTHMISKENPLLAPNKKKPKEKKYEKHDGRCTFCWKQVHKYLFQIHFSVLAVKIDNVIILFENLFPIPIEYYLIYLILSNICAFRYHHHRNRMVGVFVSMGKVNYLTHR